MPGPSSKDEGGGEEQIPCKKTGLWLVGKFAMVVVVTWRARVFVRKITNQYSRVGQLDELCSDDLHAGNNKLVI
jgi:hypothetical protein